MTNQTQQTAEQIIAGLKSRILDTQDAVQQIQAQNQELIQTLTKISQLVGAVPDEQGQVSLDALVGAVEKLVEPKEIESEAK